MVSRRLPTSVAAVLLLAAVVVLAYSTIPGVRDHVGFSPAYDGWAQCGGYVLCVVLALSVWPEGRRSRWAWAAIATYLALRAAGFLVFVLHVRTQVPPSYPSLADGLWLASDAALAVGLALVVWQSRPRLSRTLVLDSIVAALTVAALAVAKLYDPLVKASWPGAPRAQVATNVAYPIVDVALLVLVGALVVSAQGRASAAALALLVGVAATAVVDAVYLYKSVTGTFHPGSYLAPLSLAATAIIAGAAALPWRSAAPRAEQPASLAVPATMAAVCVLVLTLPPEPPNGAEVLAGIGILFAIVRGLTTLQVDREHSDRKIAAGEEELVQFKSVVDTASTFIAIAELDGRVVYLNPAGRRMVAVPPGLDVRTTSISDYLTEEGLKASFEIEQPAVLGQGHWEGESTLRRMDGAPPVPVEVYSFLVTHPETGAPWLLATAQRDITEKLATERELRELAGQRQRLLDDLVEAQEAERARIAADVHDDSVQALAAVELRLLVMHRQLERAAPELLQQCDELGATVRTASARLRHLLFDLDSPAQRSDLRSAIEEAAGYLFENDVRWRVEGDVDAPMPTRVTAYRVVKEALTNIHKHARAQHVVVTLDAEEGGLRVRVTDDGQGTAEDLTVVRAGHLGLSGMRDRAAVAGGTLTIESSPGAGTAVALWLPFGPVEDGTDQEAS